MEQQWRRVSYSQHDLESMQRDALTRVRSMQQQARHHLDQSNRSTLAEMQGQMPPSMQNTPPPKENHALPSSPSRVPHQPIVRQMEIEIPPPNEPILSVPLSASEPTIMPSHAPEPTVMPSHAPEPPPILETAPPPSEMAPPPPVPEPERVIPEVIPPEITYQRVRQEENSFSTPRRVFTMPPDGNPPQLTKGTKSLKETAIGLGGSLGETITDTIGGITSPLTKIMDTVGIDNDKLLIIGLMIVLLNEKSDKTLLMALGYLLFT